MGEVGERCTLPDSDLAEWSARSLNELMVHIVVRHHAFLRTELPWMESAIARLAEINGRSDTNTVTPLRRTFSFFKRELELHLRKEEEVLFPFIRRIEAAARSGAAMPRFSFGSIANPIGIMEEDHEGEKHQLAKMLDLTGSYSGPREPAAICDSLFGRLRALDADMGLHVRLEDEILFPRVRLLEGEL